MSYVGITLLSNVLKQTQLHVLISCSEKDWFMQLSTFFTKFTAISVNSVNPPFVDCGVQWDYPRAQPCTAELLRSPIYSYQCRRWSQRWILSAYRAMHKYHFVAKNVAPKREALRMAQESLAETQRILDAAKAQLQEVRKWCQSWSQTDS